MKILDHYPISTVEQAISLPNGGYYTAKPGQVVLTVCLRIGEHLTPAFPAFLDSGHNHNFSISEEQLKAWLNVDPSTLEYVGKLRVNREEASLRSADVLLYQNKKGSRELTKGVHEFRFSEDRGISVLSRPIHHLPLLGIRGILRQKLTLSFEGKSMSISLTS